MCRIPLRFDPVAWRPTIYDGNVTAPLVLLQRSKSAGPPGGSSSMWSLVSTLFSYADKQCHPHRYRRGKRHAALTRATKPETGHGPRLHRNHWGRRQPIVWYSERRALVLHTLETSPSESLVYGCSARTDGRAKSSSWSGSLHSIEGLGRLHGKDCFLSPAFHDRGQEGTAPKPGWNGRLGKTVVYRAPALDNAATTGVRKALAGLELRPSSALHDMDVDCTARRLVEDARKWLDWPTGRCRRRSIASLPDARRDCTARVGRNEKENRARRAGPECVVSRRAGCAIAPVEEPRVSPRGMPYVGQVHGFPSSVCRPRDQDPRPIESSRAQSQRVEARTHLSSGEDATGPEDEGAVMSGASGSARWSAPGEEHGNVLSGQVLAGQSTR